MGRSLVVPASILRLAPSHPLTTYPNTASSRRLTSVRARAERLFRLCCECVATIEVLNDGQKSIHTASLTRIKL
jgi:hypothetical protein